MNVTSMHKYRNEIARVYRDIQGKPGLLTVACDCRAAFCLPALQKGCNKSLFFFTFSQLRVLKLKMLNMRLTSSLALLADMYITCSGATAGYIIFLPTR